MKRIALTGGPGGGKTELKKHLLVTLREHGVNVLAVPEIPTIVFGMGVAVEELASPAISWLFQETVMGHQQMLEKQGEALLASRRRPNHKGDDVLLLDRTAQDQLAYMSQANFDLLLTQTYHKPQESGTDNPMRGFLERFPLVIHMVSAANGAEEYYHSKNNESRSEDLGRAREVEKNTLAVYAEHPNRVIIPNVVEGRQITFAEKLKLAEQAVVKFLCKQLS